MHVCVCVHMYAICEFVLSHILHAYVCMYMDAYACVYVCVHMQCTTQCTVLLCLTTFCNIAAIMQLHIHLVNIFFCSLNYYNNFVANQNI